MRSSPIRLDDLARRAAELWTLEPDVPARSRSQLLTELQTLEQQIDALIVRAAGGHEVPAPDVRRCARRYLWLREQWGCDEAAA